MRCLALADRWARHGEVVLATAELDGPVPERWRRHGHRVVEARPGTLRDEAPDIIILDGYHLTNEERREACLVAPTVLIDDRGHSGWHDPPAVIDANLVPGTYDAPGLLGSRYALLRPGFHPEPDPGTNVLLTFGGNAPPALVREAVDAVEAPATLVLGALQDDAEGLRQHAEARGLHVEKDVEDMATLMRRSRLAVAAAGGTTLELAACGVPALLVPLVENQQPVAAAAREHGIAHTTTWNTRFKDDVRSFLREDHRHMARRGPRLVDGRGTRRVCTWLRARLITLRPATPNDRDRVLRWNNDPVMRAMSYHPDPIAPDEHDAWWRRRLQDPHSHLLVGELDGDVGFIWFKLRDGEAVVSINVTPERRGAGLGSALVRAATDRFQTEHPVPVVAAVRHVNPASREAFLDADFNPAPDRHEFPDAWIFVRVPEVLA